VDIRLVRGTDSESRTADALRRLLAIHDLGPWIYTERIDIDERSHPHSHPILTLSTSHRGDEHLLAQFIHEQLHWYEEANALRRDAAIAATRVPYPEVPTARPDGAGDETSTRLHLLVCLLEYRVLARVIGVEHASRIIDELSQHHYRWIYRTVLRDFARIDAILRVHRMLPAGLDD
jgi:hypothetical protein